MVQKGRKRINCQTRSFFRLAKSLGPQLPKDLLELLSSPDVDSKANKVIIFTTMDKEGFPHHGMLSPFEVVAGNQNTMKMLAYSQSRSTDNIRRTGRVSFLFVDQEMSYYLKCRAVETQRKIEAAPYETVFDLTVHDVIEDKLPTAKIKTGITFEGYDPGMPREQRMEAFKALLSISKQPT